jgi:hypothetical protein
MHCPQNEHPCTTNLNTSRRLRLKYDDEITIRTGFDKWKGIFVSICCQSETFTPKMPCTPKPYDGDKSIEKFIPRGILDGADRTSVGIGAVADRITVTFADGAVRHLE